DDESSLREMMQIMLSREGYAVDTAPDGRDAVRQIEENDYDLVIADLKMPEMSGLELLECAREEKPDLPFIVMTAFASVDTAIEALKKGAVDYVTKPFKIDEIKLTIEKTLQTQALQTENRTLKRRLEEVCSFDRLLGSDARIEQVKRTAAQAAQSDATILIRGESGTGKDLLARAIHQYSSRRDKPYVAVNCGALPETLLESELFGHVKGAFTGAVRDNEGRFRAAEGGTLFLDEIAESPLSIQVKLLRVLEDKTVTPVGATKGHKVDVRLIAATNADLDAAVSAGSFRPDLYYRLNVIQINLPPLRERLDDIELLSSHFIKESCERAGCAAKDLSADALALLRQYRWPGNVRELQNVIERAVVLSKTDQLDVSDFPQKLSQTDSAVVSEETSSPTPTLESIEKAYIYWVLNQTDWQKSKAAQILGIDNSTLYRKINKYRFDPPRGDKPQGA
ncbi:MAG TPA: sigma-54 dependent transcriptional regulator, partial [candidate division Zixibacteria bacterium]|nr:sigma-54 dependent transcriptional regulator [candidate division Zixibacteria bacterium]